MHDSLPKATFVGFTGTSIDATLDLFKQVVMNSIVGDPDRLKTLAADFVQHYDTRVKEGTTLCGKAMFVCSSREIA